MFTTQRGVGHIPRFIKNKSAKGLELAMLRTQIRLKDYVEFKSIIFNSADNHWYAWYIVDVDFDEQKRAEQKIKDEKNQNVKINVEGVVLNPLEVSKQIKEALDG